MQQQSFLLFLSFNHAHLIVSYEDRKNKFIISLQVGFYYTQKNRFQNLFKFNGIWLRWQFFILILNQIEFHSVKNLNENCNNDHIPFNLKEIENLLFVV